MWFVKDINVINIQTAVESLHQKFSNIIFDAEHESIYGNGFFTPEYCKECIEVYGQAVEICENFLEGRSDIKELVEKLIDLDLKSQLSVLKNFLEEEDLLNKILESEESSDE